MNKKKHEPLTPALRKILLVASIGPFLTSLDATVVNVSLSTLVNELHASLATIQWVSSGYLLALGLMLPLTGWLVDRIGAKRLYLVCFFSFTLASALCGLAWSAESLICFRVLQGMVGGILAPMFQMMMARVAGNNIARVLGFASLPIMIGPIFGPLIAGAILQYRSWRWLFYINLPIGVLAVILAYFFLPEDHEELRPRSFDFLGFILLSPALVALLYGLDNAGKQNSILFVVCAFILLLAFIISALRKGTAALIDVNLFRAQLFSTAAITQFLTNGIAFGGAMLIPLYLIIEFHQSPINTCNMMIPLGLGVLSVALICGPVIDRIGLRCTAVAGAFVALLATIPFVYMPHLNIPVLLGALFFRGAGLAGTNIASVSATYASISKQNLPMATTSLNIVQRIGGPIIMTLLTVFLDWNLKNHSANTYSMNPFSTTFCLLCFFHTLVIVSAFRLPLRLPLRSESSAISALASPSETIESLVD